MSETTNRQRYTDPASAPNVPILIDIELNRSILGVSTEDPGSLPVSVAGMTTMDLRLVTYDRESDNAVEYQIEGIVREGSVISRPLDLDDLQWLCNIGARDFTTP